MTFLFIAILLLLIKRCLCAEKWIFRILVFHFRTGNYYLFWQPERFSSVVWIQTLEFIVTTVEYFGNTSWEIYGIFEPSSLWTCTCFLELRERMCQTWHNYKWCNKERNDCIQYIMRGNVIWRHKRNKHITGMSITQMS